MSSNIIDAIASGSSPSEVTQEIKDVLFAKSSERIDDFRQVAASNLFQGEEEGEDQGWYYQQLHITRESTTKMKLITEEINSVEFIVEEINGKKSMFIEGIFLQGNQKNRNGRVYRTDTLAREVGRYNEQYVNNGRALGELGHPDGPTVNLDRVSHKIISLTQEGNNFIGKAKLLETPMGKIAKSLVGEGVTLGVSSRGIGSLTETKEGYKLVGEDFMLSTAADIVADPSAPDAFVQGIMEGKEWVMCGGILKEQQVEDARSTINKLVTSRELQEKKLNLFTDFFSSL